MSEVEKPAWPKTPEGTIDWDVVFEDPESGVIPLMMAANSPASLHKCAEVVIRQLFTRKNDEKQVDKFLLELEGIIAEMGGGGEFERAQAAVISLLRRIKSGRIKRAQAYIDEKNAGLAAERREGASAGVFGFLFGTMVGRLITGGTVVMFLALVAVIFMLTSGENVTDETVAETPEKVEQVEEETPVEPEEINHRYFVVLEPMVWPFNVGGTKTQPVFLLPVVELNDEDDWKTICAQAPRLVEAIARSLTRNIPDGERTTEVHLGRATDYAENKIISHLHDVKIEGFSLSRNAAADMVSKGKRCQLFVK